MRFQILAFVWFAGLAIAPITLVADNGCCDESMTCCEQPAMACCVEKQEKQKPAAMPCCDEKPAATAGAHKGGCDMPCCTDHAAHRAEASEPSAIEPSAIEMLLATELKAILAPQSAPSPAAACCGPTGPGAAKR